MTGPDEGNIFHIALLILHSTNYCKSEAKQAENIFENMFLK